MNLLRLPTSPLSPGRCGRSRPRRGTIYVLILALSLLLGVVAMAALTNVQVSTRSTRQSTDWAEAGLLAQSAVEHALTALNTNSAWRTTYTNNTTAVTKSLGRGTMSWKLVDETDANLSDDANDLIRLYGTGTVGETTRVYSVLLVPGPSPLACLRPAIHAATAITNSGTLTVNGGPASTNGTFTNNTLGTVNGNIECKTKAGGILGLLAGTLNGTAVTTTTTKDTPSYLLFDAYRAKATVIPWSSIDPQGLGNFQPLLLSASANPYGATNPDGLYYLQIPVGSTMTFNPSRIRGTLLLDGVAHTSSSTITVQITGSFAWEPQRSDYPILITRNIDAVKLVGSATSITESSLGTNLNPPGSPYYGVTDNDLSDTYLSRLNGVIQIIGSSTAITLGGTQQIKGALLTDGTVTVPLLSAPTVSQDPTLFAYPPLGYTTGTAMLPMPGTWKWDTAP